MTSEQLIAALRPDVVFEVTFVESSKLWHAFYRCKPHNQNASVPHCTYKSVTAFTAELAILSAYTQCVAEKLID